MNKKTKMKSQFKETMRLDLLETRNRNQVTGLNVLMHSQTISLSTNSPLTVLSFQEQKVQITETNWKY